MAGRRVISQTPSSIGLDRDTFDEDFELYKQGLQESLEEPDNPDPAEHNVVTVSGDPGTTDHGSIPAGEIHVPHNWQVTNEGQLSTLAVTAADEGKIARVSTDNSYWTLVDAATGTWEEIGGFNVNFTQIPDLRTTDQYLIYRGGSQRVVDFCRVGFAREVETAVDITLIECNQTVHADSTLGPFTITLPERTFPDMLSIEIAKVSDDTNPITIAAPAGETINGEASCTINFKNSAVSIRRTLLGWRII